MVDMVTKPRYLWGIGSGTEVSSENMIDWQ